MKTLLRFVFLPAALLALAPVTLADTDTGPVQALRAFFTAVSNSHYDAAWALFSKHTQDGIVSSVADDEKMDPAEVRRLFETNDQSIQDGFWDSFHKSSSAETFVSVQMDSTGPSKDAPGSVLVTLPNGNSVTLLMYRERGSWKVGWFETFFPSGKISSGSQ